MLEPFPTASVTKWDVIVAFERPTIKSRVILTLGSLLVIDD